MNYLFYERKMKTWYNFIMNSLHLFHSRILKFLDNPKAVLYFIRRKMYDDFIADTYVPFYKKLRFLSAEETFNYIIDNNCSIIRFGDGEFGLIRGASVYFNGWRQKYSDDLKDGLTKALSSQEKNILVCLPGEYLTRSKIDLTASNQESEHRFWVNAKVICKNYIHKNVVYGSCFAFYPRFNTSINFLKLKKYLQTKEVVIITSNTSRFKNIELGRKTYLLEAPSRDSWDKEKEIMASFKKLTEENSLSKENTLIMVSMGSAAKVVTYNLAMGDYTAWDAGQFFDVAYKNIKEL